MIPLTLTLHGLPNPILLKQMLPISGTISAKNKISLTYACKKFILNLIQ
jgi:hypothetical protein